MRRHAIPFLLYLAIFLTACSEDRVHPQIPGWISKLTTLNNNNIKHLDAQFSILNGVDSSGPSTCIILLRNDQVVLAVFPYGNGEQIYLCQKGEPYLFANQSDVGIMVNRRIHSSTEGETLVFYNEEGAVIGRYPMTSGKTIVEPLNK